MILVSSCLCGEKCKYDGGDNLNKNVLKYLEGEEIVQVCPEVMGGLSTPRTPSEIVGGSAKDVIQGKAKVLTQSGEDVTASFLKGAYKTLEVARQFQIKKAILKAKSPSCGKGRIYDGTFQRQLIAGNGITAQILSEEGIEILTELEVVTKIQHDQQAKTL